MFQTMIDNLKQARINFAAAILEYSQNPKRKYTIEGQTVDGPAYLAQLLDGIKRINEILPMLEVYELHTVAENWP